MQAEYKRDTSAMSQMLQQGLITLTYLSLIVAHNARLVVPAFWRLYSVLIYGIERDGDCSERVEMS